MGKDHVDQAMEAMMEDVTTHPDSRAVDRFAQAMKSKMARARSKGRSGWDDPQQCSEEMLADLLLNHTRKSNPGNFVDIAVLAMMLHEREADPAVLVEVAQQAQEASGG